VKIIDLNFLHTSRRTASGRCDMLPSRIITEKNNKTKHFYW